LTGEPEPGPEAGPGPEPEGGPEAGSSSRWRNLGEKPIVETPWFELKLAEVELPGGQRLPHYLLRLPPVVLTAALDDRDRVLLLWRHRFIPDSWGWELPSGIADPAEDLPAAAAREALKESGWEPLGLRPLLRLEPSGGLTDSVNHIFWTVQARHRGDPVAHFEAERIAWIPLQQVPALVAAGRIRAAATVAALLLLHYARPAYGPPEPGPPKYGPPA
jgi:8-oxo-dGTP pyrophosphatase MutT (NUDIX family)